MGKKTNLWLWNWWRLLLLWRLFHICHKLDEKLILYVFMSFIPFEFGEFWLRKIAHVPLQTDLPSKLQPQSTHFFVIWEGIWYQNMVRTGQKSKKFESGEMLHLLNGKLEILILWKILKIIIFNKIMDGSITKASGPKNRVGGWIWDP